MTHNVKEGRIKSLLKRSKGSNHEILFHHRFATSTADVPNACHPFSTKDFFNNNYVGVHNGVISNDLELKKQQSKIGINYVSAQKNGDFNDSEALIYDISQYLEGQVEELTARGSIAFIIIKRNSNGKPVTLFFGRNHGNPLKMKKTKHSMTLSSQGEGKDIQPNQLYSYDYETGVITQRFLLIPYYNSKIWTGDNTSSTTFSQPTWDEDDDSDDYHDSRYSNGYGPVKSNKATRSVIDDGGFFPRKGTRTMIEADLLMETFGDYSEASILALIEAEEAEKEETRINEVIYAIYSEDNYDELSNYWYICNAYKLVMIEISEKFEKASRTLVDSTNSGVVVAPDEVCLLPLNLSTN